MINHRFELRIRFDAGAPRNVYGYVYVDSTERSTIHAAGVPTRSVELVVYDADADRHAPTGVAAHVTPPADATNTGDKKQTTHRVPAGHGAELVLIHRWMKRDRLWRLSDWRLELPKTLTAPTLAAYAAWMRAEKAADPSRQAVRARAEALHMARDIQGDMQREMDALRAQADEQQRRIDEQQRLIDDAEYDLVALRAEDAEADAKVDEHRDMLLTTAVWTR